MDTNAKLKVGIGTKEQEQLKPAKVIGIASSLETVKTGDKVIGDKVTIICKHPDRSEPIHLSSVKYLKKDKLKTSALWFNLDEDDKIVKNSALAIWMRHNNLETLENIDKKEFETIDDESGYLCFKAY